MSKVAEGKKVPDFVYTATGGEHGKLSKLKGQRILLYFYPKDNTPGCTREGQAFRDKYRSFSRMKTRIYGISRDSVASHEKFKSKQEFPFELITDEDETLCKMFDVIKMKNMYGKQVRGIERSTFLIDESGILQKVWRKVKVDGHADDVIDAVKALKK